MCKYKQINEQHINIILRKIFTPHNSLKDKKRKKLLKHFEEKKNKGKNKKETIMIIIKMLRITRVSRK